LILQASVPMQCRLSPHESRQSQWLASGAGLQLGDDSILSYLLDGLIDIKVLGFFFPICPLDTPETPGAYSSTFAVPPLCPTASERVKNTFSSQKLVHFLELYLLLSKMRNTHSFNPLIVTCSCIILAQATTRLRILCSLDS
jgi:hypothetical protein